MQRQGIGTALLKALFSASENEKYWTLTAEIIFDNRASFRMKNTVL
jgi:L-amino acid N-acyltransferase YncA